MNPTVSGWQEASGETERRKLDGKIFSIFSINHKMKCLRNVGFHSKDTFIDSLWDLSQQHIEQSKSERQRETRMDGWPDETCRIFHNLLFYSELCAA